jgi:cobyrinic acid a,c-diamide synthase
VVFNRVGSPRHLTYLTDALKGHTTLPCLGGMLRDDSVAIPERHLGLVTQQDHQLSEKFLTMLADLVEKNLDIDRLINTLPELSPAPVSTPDITSKSIKTRIGVAQDAAFCFYYPENIELLQQNGAHVIPFSPINDSCLPKNLDGLYFGGGYPELYAQPLAANENLRNEIKAMSAKGMPIYGECGGLMYLGQAIGDLHGQNHPMTGCLPFTTRMLSRLKRLGYREITLTNDTLLGKKGDVIRGHEFHYSEITNENISTPTSYSVTDRTGNGQIAEGYQINRTLGSYIHLHWGSFPEAAKTFVAVCHQFKQERNCQA